jgi:4-amino-4-deoxy-L-arabinose transferase-like glycosyltransferase
VADEQGAPPVAVGPVDARLADEQVVPPIAWRPVGAIASAFAVLVFAFSDGYGYHRDELYFIAIGGHPAFGYTDQPPLVPLLARAVDVVSGHSLVALRLLPALAGALVVLVTGMIAREFHGRAGEQTLAAAAMGASGVLLGSSHLMSTTTFDLLAWTVLLWLVVRAIRDGGPTWLLVGLVAGVDLQIKTLPLFLLFALTVGVLVCGPRQIFASRWFWLGALIALALWLPNMVWQATHGWPQFRLANAIASGQSGSSQPRALFVPFQLLLMGPPLTPIWIAGLWRLFRDPSVRIWRALAVAYLTLIVIFLVTGGKAYYMAGTYPVLFATGAGPALRWMRAGRGRRGVVAAAVCVTAAVSAIVALPIVPAGVLHDTPIVAMNYDAGEQVGWPALARTVARAYAALPEPEQRHAIVLTGNYGEAGAVLRYAPSVPRVYSGHNAFWDYGPPPADARMALVIGYSADDIHRWFNTVHVIARIDNGVALNNDEQGERLWLCAGPVAPWPTLWPRMRHLG